MSIITPQNNDSASAVIEERINTMKRKLLVALVAVLSVLMIGSVFMTALLQMDGGANRLSTGKYDFDLLAENAPTFNTTIPTSLLDFTTDDIQSNFGHTNQISWALKDGYTTFTSEGGDPHVYLNTPPVGKAVDCQYIVIAYRTNVSVRGEFFSTRPSTGALGTSGTNLQWEWNGNGEWNTDIVHCEAWAAASDTDTFTAFRLDTLEQNVDTGVTVPTGATLDIKYAAFFKTKNDAQNFNMDEYKKKLAYDEEQAKKEEEANKDVSWPDPTYKEMETVELDLNIGTLKYTTSEDGKSVTISYDVAGETKTYTVPNNANYTFGGYAGVDDLNRSLYNSDEVGSYVADERYVGLFYFLWQGEHGDNGVFDLQKIIDEEGLQAAGNTSCGRYGPVGAMHWFAEPLYGYYYANDAWVVRKHAELLTNANIDFLYFDVTNGYEYFNNAKQVMEALHQLNEEGYDAPQVIFYTNSSAHDVIRRLYNNIYSKDLYKDTWFCINGKPAIIGPADANINDFFTMKQNQWPTEGSKRNGWPWMDFQWPSRIFRSETGTEGSAISVSVAQHSGSVEFSTSSLYGDSSNRGRSYVNPENYRSGTSQYNQTLQDSYRAWLNDPSLTNYGLNFQAQFDHAIDSAAQYILVTGWNEWVAQRQPADGGRIRFVDTSSMEFSRDTEMMRGGYFDNYYMQLIYNVQRVKGTAPIVVQDGRKPINVTGEFDQWDDVIVNYQDPTGDTMDRNAIGFGRKNYTNTSGRNDIVNAKVTSDTKNVYFYVDTVDDITMFDTESSWMQLYVNADADAETGWYGYDYIINNQAKDTFTTTVAKYNGEDNTYSFETVGEVSYRVKDNKMMIAVPQSMLGIENYYEIELEFKWADSETLYNEMEDFYCDGDAAPLGRLNFVYQNYIEDQSVPPEVETESESDSETESESVSESASEAESVSDTLTNDTNADSESESRDNADSGCVSVLASASAALFVAILGAAVLCRKKID